LPFPLGLFDQRPLVIDQFAIQIHARIAKDGIDVAGRLDPAADDPQAAAARLRQTIEAARDKTP